MITDNDYVTRGEFNVFKKGMLEFREEFREFREAVFVSYERLETKIDTRVDKIEKDIESIIKLLTEQGERFERKFLSNDAEHSVINRRLAEIEAEL